MFSISGKLRNSDVSNSGNSGLRCFPIFSYYVILFVSCLHPSLVTLSAVGNTSLSPDPQFPLALLYCFRLCNSDPILCTQYNSIPLLSYKYLYSVPRSSRIKITIPLPLVWLVLSLISLLVTRFPDPEIPESGNSHALSNSEIRDPWGIPQGTGRYPESTPVTRIRYISIITYYKFLLLTGSRRDPVCNMKPQRDPVCNMKPQREEFYGADSLVEERPKKRHHGDSEMDV